MNFFKIILLSFMAFSCLSSNAMEYVWNKEDWSVENAEFIAQHSNDQVILYWKSFWSQIKADNIFGSTEEDSQWKIVIHQGELKLGLCWSIATCFEQKLRSCGCKSAFTLGKEVLSGTFDIDKMFIGKELLLNYGGIELISFSERPINSENTEPTSFLGIPDFDTDKFIDFERAEEEEAARKEAKEEQAQGSYYSNLSFGQNNDDSEKLSVEGQRKQKLTNNTLPLLPVNRQPLDEDEKPQPLDVDGEKPVGPKHTLQVNHFSIYASSLVSVVIAGGICYWAYNKYQAYKAACNESAQDDGQSESEELEVDQIDPKNVNKK